MMGEDDPGGRNVIFCHLASGDISVEAALLNDRVWQGERKSHESVRNNYLSSLTTCILRTPSFRLFAYSL